MKNDNIDIFELVGFSAADGFVLVRRETRERRRLMPRALAPNV
jgi:hypothetical protein